MLIRPFAAGQQGHRDKMYVVLQSTFPFAPSFLGNLVRAIPANNINNYSIKYLEQYYFLH